MKPVLYPAAILMGLVLSLIPAQSQSTFCEDGDRSCLIQTAPDNKKKVIGPVVRLYRGLGGALFSSTIDDIAADAQAKCNADVMIMGWRWNDSPPPSTRLIIGGASMGGRRAVQTTIAVSPRHVDLLLTIDPVPWTEPVPKNVGRHINWRNTRQGELGGGKPQGTKIDIPVNNTHIGTIASSRSRAVKEICALASRPKK
jgi:hypothetical protein